MILIPVKNLANAKQRLAALFSQAQRTELARAMLRDMFETLAGWPDRPEIAIVTGDPYATDLAESLGFHLIPDSENLGETQAIEMATQVSISQGADSTLVIPGDIPLLERSELAEILRRAPAEGSVLVSAADGRGTNAAFRRPANLFPLRFGNDSFHPHCAAAQASGMPVVILNLPGIALDVDNPADLEELARRPGNRHSQVLAREWLVNELPRAANQ